MVLEVDCDVFLDLIELNSKMGTAMKIEKVSAKIVMRSKLATKVATFYLLDYR